MDQVRDWTTIAAVITLFYCVSTQTTGAEAHTYLQKKHFIYAGGYWQDGQLTANSRFDSADSVSINLDELGVDRHYLSGMVDYHYRLSNRWKMSAALYRFTQRGSTQRLKDDLVWEGQDFAAGLTLDADWQINTVIVDAMYSLKQTKNFELAVGGGLHALDAKLIMAGQREITGANGSLQGFGETARSSLVVPLPNLRATGFYAFNKKWSTQFTLGWLSLSIDEYNGAFKYAHLRGQYQISDRVGLSLGYQLVEIDVKEQLKRGSRRFDMSFKGATAALTFAF